MAPHLAKMAGVWALGMVPGALYIAFNPDGIAHPTAGATGPWLQALKYTPLPHVGQLCLRRDAGQLDEMIPRASRLRLWLGLAALPASWPSGAGAAGSLRHHARRPADAAVRLHRSGAGRQNPLALRAGLRPLVFVGEASYCLYLLHFNLWNLIHDSHVLDRLGLSRFDPWISYVLLIALALLALHLVEKPAQRQLRKWMGA
jgi:peptidoglycan/LPS O-acetylase OafA/YrhL